MATNPFITAPQFYNTFEPRLRPRRDAGVAGAEYRNALSLKNDLATTVRRATANAQAEDAARKIALFESMTPDQLAGVYSRAPQTPQEEEIQRTIAGYENAGNQGFALGWHSDRQALIDSQRNASYNQQMRTAALGDQLRLEANDRAYDAADRADAANATKQQKEDRMFDQYQSKERRNIFNTAVDAVAGGTVHPDDVRTLFPDLNTNELRLVRQYGLQRQSDIQTSTSQGQGAADFWTQRLGGARQTTARGGTLAAKQEAIDTVMKEMAKAGANRDIIYDASTRSFVPIRAGGDTPRAKTSLQQPPNPFYTPTPVASQPAVNPILGAFDMLERGGAAPVDQQLATLNRRFSKAREGQTADKGTFVFSGGRWVRRR